MMLTGKNIRPDKAKRMGLVDAIVQPLGLYSLSSNLVFLKLFNY
jgi:enoyl-CoA hydratase/carnithine racemase